MTPLAFLLLLAQPAPAPTPPPDPRPEIVELASSGRTRLALERAERAAAAEPARARELGLSLLRGELLERLGRSREAVVAYAAALSENALLEPWARFRLARLQERLGHPEVAAGLVATLLARNPPPPLLRPGLELLHRGLDAGGDCRLLGGVPRERLPASERRLRDLVQAGCWTRAARAPEAARLLRDLLEDELEDAFAWEASTRLLELPGAHQPEVARLIGLAAFHHRDFASALRYLELGAAGGGRWFDTRGREVAYARARSLYWLGRYPAAAVRFAALAQPPAAPLQRADALLQLARSLELAGRQAEALEAYRRSFEADPTGEWAGSALVGAIRLQSQQGDVDGARAELLRLAAQPRLGAATARAALFLAVTELLMGDLGRAGQHLTLAERRRELAGEEAAYWRGRLAEARGDATGAVDRYLEVLERRPFHPLAELARRRLAVGAVAVAARQRALDLEGRADATSMRRAALLTAGRRLRDAVTDRLARDPRTAHWVQFQPVPVADWPLWRQATGGAGDRLAGLGLLLEAGPETVARRFPPSDPRLCFTAAGLLQASEAGVRAGIALAEELFDELPRQVPADWVAPELRRILYPFPWAGPIRVQTTALRVDPALLAAVIREESRFDPRALSPAAARGLAQLTLPTAQRLANDLGLGPLTARDLERPEVSIQLGAGHLAELARRFPGAEHVQIAAYNAGEDQAALWRRSCVTSDPAEFLAKIGYRETKAYVVRVLESRAQYADLYGRR